MGNKLGKTKDSETSDTNDTIPPEENVIEGAPVVKMVFNRDKGGGTDVNSNGSDHQSRINHQKIKLDVCNVERKSIQTGTSIMERDEVNGKKSSHDAKDTLISFRDGYLKKVSTENDAKSAKCTMDKVDNIDRLDEAGEEEISSGKDFNLECKSIVADDGEHSMTKGEDAECESIIIESDRSSVQEDSAVCESIDPKTDELQSLKDLNTKCESILADITEHSSTRVENAEYESIAMEPDRSSSDQGRSAMCESIVTETEGLLSLKHLNAKCESLVAGDDEHISARDGNTKCESINVQSDGLSSLTDLNTNCESILADDEVHSSTRDGIGKCESIVMEQDKSSSEQESSAICESIAAQTDEHPSLMDLNAKCESILAADDKHSSTMYENTKCESIIEKIDGLPSLRDLNAKCESILADDDEISWSRPGNANCESTVMGPDISSSDEEDSTICESIIIPKSDGLPSLRDLNAKCESILADDVEHSSSKNGIDKCESIVMDLDRSYPSKEGITKCESILAKNEQLLSDCDMNAKSQSVATGNNEVLWDAGNQNTNEENEVRTFQSVFDQENAAILKVGVMDNTAEKQMENDLGPTFIYDHVIGDRVESKCNQTKVAPLEDSTSITSSVCKGESPNLVINEGKLQQLKETAVSAVKTMFTDSSESSKSDPELDDEKNILPSTQLPDPELDDEKNILPSTQLPVASVEHEQKFNENDASNVLLSIGAGSMGKRITSQIGIKEGKHPVRKRNPSLDPLFFKSQQDEITQDLEFEEDKYSVSSPPVDYPDCIKIESDSESEIVPGNNSNRRGKRKKSYNESYEEGTWTSTSFPKSTHRRKKGKSPRKVVTAKMKPDNRLADCKVEIVDVDEYYYPPNKRKIVKPTLVRMGGDSGYEIVSPKYEEESSNSEWESDFSSSDSNYGDQDEDFNPRRKRKRKRKHR